MVKYTQSVSFAALAYNDMRIYTHIAETGIYKLNSFSFWCMHAGTSPMAMHHGGRT